MRKILGLAGVLALLLFPRPLAAGPLVTGAQLAFDGSVQVTVAGLIDWFPLGGGSGTAIVSPASTLSFATLAGTTLIEQDLNQAAFPVGPAGTFAPLPNFETLVAQPTTNFTLLAINPCAINCLAGAASPFNFIELPSGDPNNPINTTVILSMIGIVTDPVLNPGQVFSWSGQWDATFTGQTGAQILNQLVATGFINAAYSGEKLVIGQQQVIPEPASMLLLGTGLVGLAARARRRLAKPRA